MARKKTGKKAVPKRKVKKKPQGSREEVYIQQSFFSSLFELLNAPVG